MFERWFGVQVCVTFEWYYCEGEIRRTPLISFSNELVADSTLEFLDKLVSTLLLLKVFLSGALDFAIGETRVGSMSISLEIEPGVLGVEGGA